MILIVETAMVPILIVKHHPSPSITIHPLVLEYVLLVLVLVLLYSTGSCTASSFSR